MKIVYVHLGWSMSYPFSPRTWSLNEWQRWFSLLHKNGVEIIMIWPGYEFINPDSMDEIEVMTRWTQQIIDICHSAGLRLWLGRSINAVVVRQHKSLMERDVRDTSEVSVTTPDYQSKVISVLERIFKDTARFEGWWCIDRDPGACLGTQPQDFAKAFKAQFLAVQHAQQAIYWMWGGWTDVLNQEASWRTQSQTFWQEALRCLSGDFPDLRALCCWPGHWASCPDGIDQRYAFPYHFGEPEPSIPWSYMGEQEPRYHFSPAEIAGSKPSFSREVIFNMQTPCLRTPYLLQRLQGAPSSPTLWQDLQRAWCWSERSLENLCRPWQLMNEACAHSKPESTVLSDWIAFTACHFPHKRGFLHERFSHV